MTAIYILAGLAALFGSIAIAATSVALTSRAHYRERLFDRSIELDRATLRIDALERMLDESRAAALNVAAPPARDYVPPVGLPAEVLAELDLIDDDATRAEMEADIRIQIEAHPEQDPIDIARSVIGG